MEKFSRFLKKNPIGMMSALLCILIVGFYSYFTFPYWNKSMAWRDINIPELKLGDESVYELSDGYLIKNGQKRKVQFELNPFKLVENDRVLRLAIFYQINREDPLFTAPGVNEPEYKAAVDRLALSHSELLEATGFKENVMPISFLQKTVEMLTTNNDFIGNPSNLRANNLLTKGKEVNARYKVEAEDLTRKLIDMNIKQEKFILSGSVTTKTIILGDLKKISDNSKKMDAEIDSRSRCLNISIIFCSRKIEDIIVDDGGISEPQGNVRVLDANELYYPEDKQRVKLSGPYILQSKCWKRSENQTDEQYLYQMVIKSDKQTLSYVPKIATTNFYQSPSRGAAGTIDKQYTEHKLVWRPVLVTSPYSCSEQDFVTELNTLEGYYEKYFNKNLLDLKTDDLPQKYKEMIKGGQEAEKIFFTEEYPSQKALDSIGRYYRALYKMIIMDENQGDNRKLSEEMISKKSELLDRYLYIERKMGNFDRTLGYLAFFLDRYSQTYKLNTGNRAGYVYYIRNNYPLTYLGFSKSVWREGEALMYMKKNEVMSSEIKGYDEMVNLYGKEYVLSNLNIPRSQIYVEMLGHVIEE